MNLISAVHVAGTGGELRTLWVASEFFRLDDLTPEKPVLDVGCGLGGQRTLLLVAMVVR